MTIQGNNHIKISIIRMNRTVQKRGNKPQSMILLNNGPRSTALLQSARQKKCRKQAHNQLTTLHTPPTFRSVSLKQDQKNTFLSKAARRHSAMLTNPNKMYQLNNNHIKIHSKDNLSSAMSPFTLLDYLKSSLFLSKGSKEMNLAVEARQKFVFHMGSQVINLLRLSVDNLRR